MEKYKLDIIDRRILSELSIDCRQDNSALARKLKLGRDRVKYRINKLQSAGIIPGYTIRINPYKFGLCLYKTYFRLDNDKEKIQKLLHYLDNHPRSFWIAECHGHWDLIHAMYAENAFTFQSMQDDLLTKFNNVILSSNMYVVTSVWYFSRGYFSGASVDKLSHGGEPSDITLTELDFKILKLLSQDARQAISAVAGKLKCAPATVRYRLERLEQLGVIAMYRSDIDVSRLGMIFFKAQVHLSEYNIHKEEELKSYCMHNPNIVCFLKQIGDCKIELELEVEDFENYNDIIDDIRGRFHGYIKNIETILIRKHRYKSIPTDLIKVN